jgi:ABC-2 type transport system ATP-binding protein
MNSIVTKNLHAEIGDFELQDINLSIPEGSIIGLIGRNGAGKTTLFKTLNGTYLKTSGEIKIAGMDYADSEKEIRMSMAVVYDVFTGNPYARVKFLRKIYMQSHPMFDVVLFDELIDKFGIDVKKRVVNLSFGMQKKLMLILALSVHPTILLLDEPLIGIDPIDKNEFIKLIQAYMENDKHSIILSSHQVDDLQKIADYIMFINNGKIVLFENKETLLEQYKIVIFDKEDERKKLLINPTINSLGIQGLIQTNDLKDLQVNTKPASLEQIFVHLCT